MNGVGEIHFQDINSSDFDNCIFLHKDNSISDNLFVNFHRDFEIIYVKSGIARLYNNDGYIDLHEHEALLINPYAVHFGFAKTHNTTYYAIVFNNSLLQMKLESDSKTDIFSKVMNGTMMFKTEPIKPALYPNIIRTIENIIDLYDNRQLGWRLDFISCFYSLAAQLLRASYLTDSKYAGNFTSNEYYDDIKTCIEYTNYIKINYSKKLLIKDIVCRLNISESKLYKSCMKTLRCSPIKYIISFRLNQAANMLLTTADSVTSISLDCGFDNVSYFIKCFQSAYGLSPNSYRKQYTE